jgi:hypothetical protein
MSDHPALSAALATWEHAEELSSSLRTPQPGFSGPLTREDQRELLATMQRAIEGLAQGVSHIWQAMTDQRAAEPAGRAVDDLIHAIVHMEAGRSPLYEADTASRRAQLAAADSPDSRTQAERAAALDAAPHRASGAKEHRPADVQGKRRPGGGGPDRMSPAQLAGMSFPDGAAAGLRPDAGTGPASGQAASVTTRRHADHNPGTVRRQRHL